MISALGANSVSSIPTKSNQTPAKFSLESQSAPQSAPQDSTSVTLTSTQAITDLRAKFNVTDISNKDAASLSLNLKNNGLIGGFEAANLSIAIVPPGSTYNPDARVNLVKQVQSQLESSRQFGSAEQTQSLSHVLDVLRDLQR